jgi:hypothetical protein
MKRLASLLQQDLTLSYRSSHLLITAVLLAIMLALVLLLPKELRIQNEIILDVAEGQPLVAYLNGIRAPAEAIYTDEAAFRAELQRQPQKMGVIFSGSLADPRFEIITQSVMAAENVGQLQASLNVAVLEMRGRESPTVPVKILRPPAPPPPFNLHVIPMILVFEVVLLGYFIASVMMFQEKQEGTLLAYRVTPAGTVNYILSNSALFLILSLCYGLPILLVGFGFMAPYGLLVLPIVLSSLFMTLFGLMIAVFFRNISEWFFVGVAVIIINSIPMLAYGFPSFAPPWITWIPSYPAVFTIRNLLFHSAGLAEIRPDLVYLVAVNVLAFAGAYTAVRYKLLREGR